LSIHSRVEERIHSL